MTRLFKYIPNKATGLALIIGTLGLSACVTQPPSFGGGIDFRETRYNEINAMRDYRQCREHALELDEQAQQSHDSAKFIASAKMIETCEARLGPEVAGLDRDERMRTYALSIQNYLKGGDIDQARTNLEKFNQTFDGQDLFYADGSSFSHTMEVLLGVRGAGSIGRFSNANVNQDLKSELRRVRYWETH